jgi:hypothetical protein
MAAKENFLVGAQFPKYAFLASTPPRRKKLNARMAFLVIS